MSNYLISTKNFRKNKYSKKFKKTKCKPNQYFDRKSKKCKLKTKKNRRKKQKKKKILSKLNYKLENSILVSNSDTIIIEKLYSRIKIYNNYIEEIKYYSNKLNHVYSSKNYNSNNDTVLKETITKNGFKRILFIIKSILEEIENETIIKNKPHRHINRQFITKILQTIKKKYNSNNVFIFYDYLDRLKGTILIPGVEIIVKKISEKIPKKNSINESNNDIKTLYTILQKFDTFFKSKNININTDKLEKVKIEDSDKHFIDSLPVTTFTIKSQKFVLKPRKAEIDIKILQLFDNINKISSIKLPVYNIVNVPNCNYSIWDYIDGFTSKIHTLDQLTFNTPININGEIKPYFEYFKMSNTKTNTLFLNDYIINHNITLRKNSMFLNLVSTNIGLTDLHHENYIIKDNMVYLIDLEVITPGDYTGLLDITIKYDEDIIEEYNKISHLIDDFNGEITNIKHRFIPIKTTLLKQYFYISNTPKDIIDEIEKTFMSNIQKFNLKADFKNVLARFEKMKSLNIRLIPYFYIYKNHLYLRNYKIDGNDFVIGHPSK